MISSIAFRFWLASRAADPFCDALAAVVTGKGLLPTQKHGSLRRRLGATQRFCFVKEH
jgi:hypothetical protein